MSHENDADIRDAVYAGNYKLAVELAYNRYLADPKGKLVMYVSTLYSARDSRDFVKQEFNRWVDNVMPRLVDDIDRLFEADDADALDVASTVLLWWSARDNSARSARLITALRANNLGMMLTEKAPVCEHTRPLLKLTRALIFLEQGNTYGPRDLVAEVSSEAGGVRDVRQRIRILRKLAFLWFKLGRPLESLYWLVRSFTEPTSPGKSWMVE